MLIKDDYQFMLIALVNTIDRIKIIELKLILTAEFNK